MNRSSSGEEWSGSSSKRACSSLKTVSASEKLIPSCAHWPPLWLGPTRSGARPSAECKHIVLTIATGRVVPPNVLAITCGVQRRQVHRLVGGTAVQTSIIAPCPRCWNAAFRTLPRWVVLFLQRHHRAFPIESVSRGSLPKCTGTLHRNRQVRILQIILTENASMRSRTRGSIGS
jgi:hypothetical protein